MSYSLGSPLGDFHVSVSLFRELMQRPGCKVFFIILFSVLGLSFLITLPGVKGCSAGQDMADSSQRDTGTAVAMVDDVRITEQNINQQAMAELNPVTATPSTAATAFGRAADQAVTQAYLALLAKQLGVSMDDKTIIAAETRMLDLQAEYLAQMNK